MTNSFQNMVQIIILLFVIAIILQQCTTINLNVPFKKKEYNNYSYLKDGVKSKNYIIEPLPNKYPPIVTYHPTQNYFIIEADSVYLKLGSKGNELATIVREKGMEVPKFTHYIFSVRGVYNLSDEKIIEVPFKEVLNADRSISKNSWKVLFDQYYKAAEIVIYGKGLPYSEGEGFPVFFKIKEEWFKLLTGKHVLRANDDSEALKHVYPGYPAKFTRTVVLKDPLKKTFSNREREEYLLVNSDRKNYTLSYSNSRKIKSLYFNKEMVDDEIAYTPIPISFSGTSYYRIKMNEGILNFKESATKPIFMPVRNHFHWYILPDTCFNSSNVSFLEVQYPHNINNSGSDGLYIIRPK